MEVKRALEITYLMWQWIADNKAKSKVDFFDSEYSDTIMSKQERAIIRMDQMCACCTYDLSLVEGMPVCSNCPLVGLWGNDCEDPRWPERYACENNNDSPFDKWLSYRKSKDAQKIANMAFKRLQDYCYEKI